MLVIQTWYQKTQNLLKITFSKTQDKCKLLLNFREKPANYFSEIIRND